ncbi:GNAT family N-acetyltransferase [Aurantibacillus circumpalustris]|uniref:GNAT family N-acetyltransferase n=1 Tax=Aurantibacillus circumpalustris TaxID=3036359 RepID=UPI00295B5AD4|nr:GNAT family N-acetyltransferase [Aurantibacillus circumpalustris]
MNPTLKYRTGNLNDLKELKALGLVTFGQYQSQLLPEHWKTLLDNLQNEERLLELIKVSKTFVCLHDNKIIGRAFLVPKGNPTPIFEKEWAQIRMVGVDSNYAGQGIAKELTRLCIEEAKQLNEKIIALHTSEMMVAARHIYESIGFKQVKEIDDLFGKRYWLYHLEI